MQKTLSEHLEFWDMVAEYYERKVSPKVAMMYASDTSQFTIDQLHTAWKDYRLKGNQFFPMPGTLMEFISPETTDEFEAKEVAARIPGAVSRFGWCNREEAKNYIGDIGWQIVETMGGWQHLCETMHDDMIPTFVAQYRELAKSKIQRKKAGLENQPPEFDKLSGNQENIDKIKKLVGGDDEDSP